MKDYSFCKKTLSWLDVMHDINKPIICLDSSFAIIDINEYALDIHSFKKQFVMKQDYRQICAKKRWPNPFDKSPYHNNGMVKCEYAHKNVKYIISWVIIKIYNKKNDGSSICNYVLFGDDITKEEDFCSTLINYKVEKKETKEFLLAKVKEFIGCSANEEDGIKDLIDRIYYHFGNIVANLPGFVYWKDKNGVYRGANDNVAKLIGFDDKREIIGKNDYDLAGVLGWSNEVVDNFVRDDKKVIKTKKTILNQEEQPFISADGHEIIELSNRVPLYDKDHKLVGVLCNTIDITERKLMEKALIIAKEKAEVANQIKTQFMMNMEHDIRTPSSGIVAMSKILETKEKDPEKKELLSYIAKASKQLLDLLDSVLEFDRISTREVAILSKKFNIRKIINDVIDLEKPLLKTKNLKILHNYKPEVPQVVIGDPNRILRIVLNLVGNAIKFTIRGHIKVSVDLVKKINRRNVIIKLTVKDTGIGISKDHQQIIYERFSRITPSNEGTYKGSGLGLSIVKQFIEDVGGEIDVESELGKGTTFTCLIPFRLPLLSIKATKNVEEMDCKIEIQKLNIMLVEDDDLAQKVASIMLINEFSNNLDTANTGKEALKLSNKNKYDLIFMDVGLPDISGYEVTKKIRKLKRSKNKNTVIIALTAHNSVDAEQESLKSGMNGFLIKPLEPKKILKTINKYISTGFRQKILETPKRDMDTNKPTDLENEKAINLELGVQLAGGNTKLAKEMLVMLANELPEHKIALKKSFDSKDMESLQKQAHKLHGATCYCGTPRLKKAAENLETILKQNVSINKIKPNYDKLVTEINTVLKNSCFSTNTST